MKPYEFNSAAYATSRCTQDEIRSQRIVPLVGSNRVVLDVGCLDGTVAELFLKNGNTVYGVDASRPAIEKALQRGIKAELGNLEEPLRFEDGFFDVVFAGEIIEHVYDIDLFLSEIFRVLKPGGSLVVTTPNLATLGRRLLLLMGKNPHIEISFTGDAAGHIRYFIRDTLADILHKHGFAIALFTSDSVNFNGSGTRHSEWLARLIPSLGRTLIMKVQKDDK